MTAGLVAAQDPAVSGLVLISGVYDLPAYVKSPRASTGVVMSLMAETGGSGDALESRSVMRHAREIKAASLILGGAKDDRTDPDQARVLADLIAGAGGNATASNAPAEAGSRLGGNSPGRRRGVLATSERSWLLR
jgi:dipeptidyl aminopeptidase/acylaminoacyl peptidase